MVERALLTALVVLMLLGVASAITTSFHKMADRIDCGIRSAELCILDDAKER